MVLQERPAGVVGSPTVPYLELLQPRAVGFSANLEDSAEHRRGRIAGVKGGSGGHSHRWASEAEMQAKIGQAWPVESSRQPVLRMPPCSEGDAGWHNQGPADSASDLALAAKSYEEAAESANLATDPAQQTGHLSCLHSSSGSSGDSVSHRSSAELWAKARQATQRISILKRFNTLRDMCPESIIDASRLQYIKRLGAGSFATVDLCLLELDDMQLQVAVKRMRPRVFSSAEEVRLFGEEINILRKLKHPCVVNFIGVGSTDSSSWEAQRRTTFLVQEYLNQNHLKAKLLQQLLLQRMTVYTDRDALRWSTQIARGLAYLHRSNPVVIHRDLKLENVMLHGGPAAEDQNAKIADFGLHATQVSPPSSALSMQLRKLVRNDKSKEAHDEVAIEKAHKQHMARSLEPVCELTGKTGSYLYMAPEVLLGKRYNEKVDVFSFAIVIYQLFSRYLLSAGMHSVEHVEAYAYKVAAGFRPPLPKSWPQQLQLLISDCWSADPKHRPSMQEVVERLQDMEADGVMQQLEALQNVLQTQQQCSREIQADEQPPACGCFPFWGRRR